jgi:hypothetical protein
MSGEKTGIYDLGIILSHTPRTKGAEDKKPRRTQRKYETRGLMQDA